MRNSGESPQPIHILRYLHSVLVGLAVISGIRFLIDSTPSGSSPIPTEVPAEAYLMFAALVITVVPFFHGTMIHAQNAYSTSTQGEFQPMVDLLVLVAQGAILFAMANVLGHPDAFLAWFAIILGVDAAFFVLAKLAALGTENTSPPAVWAWGNLVVLAAVLILILASIPEFVLDDYGQVISFGLAIGRTALDYYFGRDYYF